MFFAMGYNFGVKCDVLMAECIHLQCIMIVFIYLMYGVNFKNSINYCDVNINCGMWRY